MFQNTIYQFFNTNSTKLFKINNFVINKPLNILTLDNKYLSCCIINNIIDFYDKDDNSNRQKWIIEKDHINENIFYIKCLFTRYNSSQYLGCPNKNNQVFLYTTKNKYTRWSIEHIQENIYYIKYIGEKFDNKVLSLIVSRYNENIEWVYAYNDIAIVYNKGSELDIPFVNIKKLENIGREGHTYLYHVIQNYNNLSNKIFFLQGDPFIHNETILFAIDNYEKLIDVQPLGLQYLTKLNIPPFEMLEKNKIKTDYGLEYSLLNINNNLYYIEPYTFHDKGILELIKKYKQRFPECNSLVENFLNRSKFPRVKQIDNITFSWSGLFSVIESKIKKYQVFVYENLPGLSSPSCLSIKS
jgi:hypothetical protein